MLAASGGTTAPSDICGRPGQHREDEGRFAAPHTPQCFQAAPCEAQAPLRDVESAPSITALAAQPRAINERSKSVRLIPTVNRRNPGCERWDSCCF